MKINLQLTPDQADAVVKALDLYTRICIGQLEEVTSLVRFGVIPKAEFHDVMGERQLAQRECIDALDTAMLHAKFHLGYPSNGSMGIGHPHVHVTAKRAYEVEKVLDKVLSEHKDPSPKFRGVNYDGLIVRYTNDPEPTASVDNV